MQFKVNCAFKILDTFWSIFRHSLLFHTNIEELNQTIEIELKSL